MTHIVGILLAAGQGTRFGGAKLLAPLPVASHGAVAGTPVGVAACRHLVAAVGDVVAVIRPGDPALAQQLHEAGARVVECQRADDGMGASLACGVTAASDADGWVVALADMPWLAPATIISVHDALASGADIAAPIIDGERAHPVGFSRRHFAALVALTGDGSAKSLVEENRQSLRLIATDDQGARRDVDTALDLHGQRLA